MENKVYIGLDFGFGKDVSVMKEIRPTLERSVSNKSKCPKKWNLPEKIEVRQEDNSELINELKNYSWVNTKDYDGI